MKKVILTGSAGFVGSYIAQELLNNNYIVIGIDDYSKYGEISRPQDKNPEYSFLKLNLISEREKFEQILFQESPDFIIHAAAKIGGISYFHTKQFDLIRDNAIIDANVIGAAVNYWQHNPKLLKRLVAISSSMVFENASNFPTEEDHACLPPLSTYGFSKLSLEYLCKGAIEQYKIPITITRLFNAVGIGEDDFIVGEKSHVVPDLIVKLLKIDGPLEILGNGAQIRHYSAASDLARGIRLAMESKISEGQTYNISTPRATTVLELAEILWYRIRPNQSFEHRCDAPFRYDVQKRSPNVTKALKDLNFMTEISLEESLDECIEYIRKKLNINV